MITQFAKNNAFKILHNTGKNVIRNADNCLCNIGVN